MVAKSDPDDYGRLETYVMPSDNLPNGPSVVSEQMKSDSAVASEQTLLCQRGSECELRNLVLVPIENSHPLRAVAVRARRRLGHPRAAPGDRLVPDRGRRQPHRGLRDAAGRPAEAVPASASRTHSSRRPARTQMAAEDGGLGGLGRLATEGR